MKRIIIGFGVIGVVAALAIGATVAYFNDTEISTGNILVAGNMDLKVDHLRQTYNGIDCNTCNLTLISDPTNTVVKKNGSPVTPYSAVFVGSNPPYFIHSAWTAQNDPELAAAGARWIWESDPTRPEDTTQDVSYTFEKTFEWYGPILSSDLWFGIGSDNSIKVWLNGNLIAENDMERGYRQENMLHIPGSAVNGLIQQGTNVLTLEVKNWTPVGYEGTPYRNPGGLIYKFFISGNCQDNYFKAHCQLWGEKDLTNEKFFTFDDVKPGDSGTNIISLHVLGNDAYSCLLVTDQQDNENVLTPPEANAGDATNDPNGGELSQFLSAVVWSDTNSDKQYNAGEPILYGPAVLKDMKNMLRLPLTTASTTYVGLAWCLGAQNVDQVNGIISCSGAGHQDIAQTDAFLASLTAYSQQQRNNDGFSCASLALPPSTPD